MPNDPAFDYCTECEMRKATCADVNGVPLCGECYADLCRETARLEDPDAQ